MAPGNAGTVFAKTCKGVAIEYENIQEFWQKA